MEVEIRLFDLMAKNNMRFIQELHDKSGLSRNLISRILNGERANLKLETIVVLCDVLDCGIGDLIKVKKTG